jgi:hypothetical protein
VIIWVSSMRSLTPGKVGNPTPSSAGIIPFKSGLQKPWLKYGSGQFAPFRRVWVMTGRMLQYALPDEL